MIRFTDCENIYVAGVTLQNAAKFHIIPTRCKNVIIDGIMVRCPWNAQNGDAIDLSSCRNALVVNCIVDAGDDGICMKAGAGKRGEEYGPCENIVVSNCTLTSTSAAIKFGSESEALFRNILIENCIISRSNRGISLQLRDPGSIENVIFQNITISTRLFKDMFWGQAEPIAITVLRRKPETEVGCVRNIRFQNIFCDSENGILIYGEEPGKIDNIRFEGVSLHLQRKTDHPIGIHDLRPTCGPLSTQAGLAHIHVHGASRVRFRDCQWSSDLPAQLCIEEECRALSIEGGEQLC
jgi:polygalacturonase